MHPRYVLLIVSGGLVALSLAFAGYSVRASAQARTRLLQAQAQAGQLDARLAEERASAATRRGDLERMRARLTAAETHAKASGSASPGSLSERINRVLATHPKLRDMQFELFKERLDERFARTFQQLQLTPEQVARFNDMATAHEFDRENLYELAIKEGLDVNDPKFSQLHQQSMEEYYAALGAQISPALEQAVRGLDDLRNRTVALTALVADSSALLVNQGAPMTRDQQFDAVQALAASSHSFVGGGNATMGSIDWDQAYRRVAPVLTAEQVAVLKARVEFQQVSADVKAFYEAGSPRPR